MKFKAQWLYKSCLCGILTVAGFIAGVVWGGKPYRDMDARIVSLDRSGEQPLFRVESFYTQSGKRVLHGTIIELDPTLNDKSIMVYVDGHLMQTRHVGAVSDP